MSLFSNLFKPSRHPAEQDGLFSGKNKFITASHEETTKPTLEIAIQNDSQTKGPVKVRSSSTKLRKAKEERQDNQSTDKPVRVSDLSKPSSDGKNKMRKSLNLDEMEKTEVGPTLVSKRRKTHASEKHFPVVNEELMREKGNKNSSDGSRQNTSRSEKDSLSVQEILRLKRTVFVGNLPSVAVKRSKKLERLFSKFGTIESVRLRSIPIKVDANMPRRAAIISGAIDEQRGSAHAYVVFKDEAAAKAALSLNMQLWEGAHLRVDRAVVGKVANGCAIKDESDTFAGERAYSAVYESTRSVFLGNLSTNIEDEQVIQFFIEGLGAEADKELEGVRIVRDPKTSVGKGIGFALFKSTKTRKAALSLDGRQLCGRPIRIMPVKKTKDTDKKLESKSWQGMKSKRNVAMRRVQSVESGVKKFKHQGDKKGRQVKRPAVAARKARQLAIKKK